MAATSALDSISDCISTRNNDTRPGLLRRINSRVAGRTGVYLDGIRDRRTRHSGDDRSRHHRSHSRLCRAGISPAGRSHCSTLASPSSDHIRVRVDNSRPFGKMDVPPTPVLFCVAEALTQPPSHRGPNCSSFTYSIMLTKLITCCTMLTTLCI